MRESQTARRAGYAPTNTELGRRGLHTRAAIVRSAAHLFLTHGMHGTSVEAIAKASGSSRATVYQYFEDKEAIYRELVAQCAPDVADHVKVLGRLGPDVEGLLNLSRWLEHWANLYDQHAVVLLDFPGIGNPGAVVHAAPNPYVEALTDRLRTEGVQGMNPEDAAAAFVRIAHMVNVYRHRGMFNLPDSATVTYSTTIALQAMLFPDTPQAVLSALPRPPVINFDCAPQSLSSLPPTSKAPAAPSPVRADIAAAASTLFARAGYHSTSMDDIAVAANVSRATLYRHFRTKLAILSELTNWAIIEGQDVAAGLQRLADDGFTRDSLHTWLARYVRFHRAYAGVNSTWYDGGVSTRLSDAVTAAMRPFQAAATALLRRSGLPAGIDLRVGTAVFLGILGRLTEMADVGGCEEADDETAEFMLRVITRAFDMHC